MGMKNTSELIAEAHLEIKVFEFGMATHVHSESDFRSNRNAIRSVILTILCEQTVAAKSCQQKKQ